MNNLTLLYRQKANETLCERMWTERERALNEYQRALDTNDNSQGSQEIANKYIRQPYKYEGSQQLIQ